MKEDNIIDADIVNETKDDTKDSAPQCKKMRPLKDRLLSAAPWLRFVFMVLFIAIVVVAGYVMAVLVAIQFVFALVSDGNDEKLQRFGCNLSQYIFQILCFLTYNTEDKPFPFADFPQVNPSADIDT